MPIIPVAVFSVRNALVTDIPMIRELTFAIWPQTYEGLLSPDQLEYMLDMMYSPASLEKQMAEGAEFVIVYDDQLPVGFASYQEIKPGIYKLHKLYILKTQQGKGTGRLTLEHIIREIKPRGASSLQLQVKRDNPAQHFYSKLGFEIIEEADFDIGNGYQMNDYIMEKKL